MGLGPGAQLQGAICVMSSVLMETFVKVAHAANRAFCVDQAVSNNLYLPGDVDLWDLHNLHFQAWEKGVKSLYYCRSRSVQRADRVTHVAGEMPQPEQAAKEVDYDECLSCQ